MLLTLDSLISEEKERRRSVQELAKQADRGVKGVHTSTGPSSDTESITASIRKIVATDAEEEEEGKADSSFILREVPKSDSRSTAAEAGPSASLFTDEAVAATAKPSSSALGKALSSAATHKQWVTDVLYLNSALSKTSMRRLLSAPTLIANAFPTEFNEYFELLKTPRSTSSILTSQTYGSASLYSRPTSYSYSSYSGAEAYFLAIAHAWRRVVVEDKRHRSFFTQGKGLLSYALHSSGASRRNGDASLTGASVRGDSKTRILFCENSVTFFVELLKSAVEIDRRWKRQSDSMSIISAAGQREGPLKDDAKRDDSFLTQFAAVVIGGVLPKTLGIRFGDTSVEPNAIPADDVVDSDRDGGANPMPLQLIAAIFLALHKERSSLLSVWLSAWLSWDLTTEATLSVLTNVVEQCAEEMAATSDVDKEEGGEGVSGVTARVLKDSDGDDDQDAYGGGEDEEVVERLEGVVSVVADAVWGLLFDEGTSLSTIVPAWLTVWRFARSLLEKAEERLARASGPATNRKGMDLLVAKALTSVVQNTICDRVAQDWSSPDFVYTYDGSSAAGGKGPAGGERGRGDRIANLLLCFLTMVPSRESRLAKSTSTHRISLIFSSSARKDGDSSDEGDADSDKNRKSPPKDDKRSSTTVSLKIPLASIFDGINHHFSATSDGPRKIGATVAVAYTSIMSHLHPNLGSGKNKKKPSGKKSAEDGEDLDEDDILNGGALEPLAPLDFDAYPQCLPAWLNDTLLRSLKIFSPQKPIRGLSSGGGGALSSSTLFGLSVVPPFVALVNDSSALAAAIIPSKEGGRGGGGQVLAGGGSAGDDTIAAILSHRQAQQAAKNTASSSKKAAASFVNMGSIPIARLLPLPLPSLSDPNIAINTAKANSTNTSLRRIQLRGRIVIKKSKGNVSSEDARDEGCVAVSIDDVVSNLNLPAFGKTSFVETPKQVGASAYLGTPSSASSLPAVRTVVEGLRLLCAIGAKPNESERDRALATEAALRALPSLLRSLVIPPPPPSGSNSGPSSYFLVGNPTNTAANGTLHHERVATRGTTTTNETDNYPTTGAATNNSSRHFLIVGDASNKSADGHRSFAEELLMDFPSSPSSLHGGGIVVPSRDRDEQAMIARRRDPFAIAESAIAPMASHAILALVCCDVVFPQTMQAEMDALRLEVLTLIMAMCPLVSLHQASIMLFHSNFSVSQRVMLYHGLQGALRLWADAPRSGAEAQADAPLAGGKGNMNSSSPPSVHHDDNDSNNQNKTSSAPAERRVYPPIEDDAHVATMFSARETIAARIEQKTRRWGHAVKGRGSHSNNRGYGSTSNKGGARVRNNRVHLFAEAVVTALLEFYDENERMKRRQTDAKNGPKRSQFVTELGSDGDSAVSSQDGRSIHSFSFLAEADMLYAPAELLRTIHVLFENFVTPAGSIITLSTRVLPFLQEAIKHPHASVRAQAWATITTVMIQFSLAVQTVEEPAARNVLFAFLGALTPVARAALGGGGGGGRGRGARLVAEPETSALCRATITEFINLAMSIVGM